MPASDDPGAEDLGHALLLQRRDVGVGMTPPPNTSTSSRPRALQLLHHPREQREVGAGRAATGPTASASSCMRGLGDLLGRLVQAGVDDLEAGVAQGAGDGLRPAVVAVEARLGHDTR